MLGLCEAKFGDNKSALDHIERGRAMGGNDPRIRPVMLFTEGNWLLEAGQFGKAQDVLDSLAREGAEQDEFIVALGCAVAGINPCEKIELARRSGWAEHYAARQDVEKAMQEYQRLTRDYPKTRNVQFAFGRFLLASHMDDEASRRSSARSAILRTICLLVWESRASRLRPTLRAASLMPARLSNSRRTYPRLTTCSGCCF
jgi:hypothetical protein